MNDQHQIQLTVHGYPVATRGVIVPKGIQGIQSLIAWRNQHADAPDAWLREDVCKAFQFFIGLRLGNPPAAEMMPVTAEMWIEIIGEGMTEEVDRERIRKGFQLLRRELKWWPQPEALLKVLPRRERRGDPCDRPPQAQPTDEEHANIAAKFEELINNLSGEMKVPNYEALDRQGIEKMKSEFIKKNLEE